MVSDRELMRLHVETLFVHDQRGDMVRVNEPSGKPSPRVFIGIAQDGVIHRFRDDVSNTRSSRPAFCVPEASPDTQNAILIEPGKRLAWSTRTAREPVRLISATSPSPTSTTAAVTTRACNEQQTT